jgi:hypothetical protein
MDEVKTCTKCLKEKPFSDFYKTKRGKNGLTSWCKLCLGEWNKQDRATNPEKYKERYRKWCVSNRDKWYLSFKDGWNERRRESYNKLKTEEPEKHKAMLQDIYQKRKQKRIKQAKPPKRQRKPYSVKDTGNKKNNSRRWAYQGFSDTK